MDYIIERSRYDYKPHIFEAKSILARHDPVEMIYDEIWDGLVIKVAADIPAHEIGEEFDLLGRRFVIISIWYAARIYTCAVANTEGYRLLLHQLIFDTELTLLMRGTWFGMPTHMRHECFEDYMNTPY